VGFGGVGGWVGGWAPHPPNPKPPIPNPQSPIIFYYFKIYLILFLIKKIKFNDKIKNIHW